jgi:uracil-DNA glycosylase
MARLLALLDGLPNCEGVFRIRCEIAGYPAFFPGGVGYKGDVFPNRPILFIGHNFDSESNFKASVQRGFEGGSRAKTWPNLLAHFLPEAGVREEQCFFSNFYLGAIAEKNKSPHLSKQKNIGKFPCSREYHAACVQAVRKQVEIIRPSVIALLGAYVPVPFSQAFPEYKVIASESLTETQAKQPLGGFRVFFGVGLHAQVVALVHPSNPRSNASHKEQGRLLRGALKAFEA